MTVRPSSLTNRYSVGRLNLETPHCRQPSGTPSPALLAENDRLASQVVQLRAALERVAILGADSYDAQANACHDEALAALAAAKGGAS